MTAPVTLCTALADSARRHAERPAMTFLDAALEPTSYTYQRLFARAEELADRLRAHQLAPQAPLGILTCRQETQTLVYLAALAAGLVPAILTPPNRKLDRRQYLDTLRAVAGRGRFSALVTDLDDVDADVTLLDAGRLQIRRRGPSPKITADLDDAALVQFSSGTTGIKRGVVVSHRAVLAQLRAYGVAIGLEARDVIASWLPLYHDMGFIACLNLPLAAGSHVVMIEPMDWVGNTALYLRAVSDYRATLGWHPNFAFAFMAQRVRPGDVAGLDLSSLRGLVNCAEPVTEQSQRQFAERLAAASLRPDVFWGCYAMAETTFALTHGTAAEDRYLDEAGPVEACDAAAPLPVVSVGRPIAGVTLRVVDERGDPLPDRHIGELHARSPFTMQGYYHNAAATAEAIEGGWYKTGDLGYRIGEQFFVRGRRKELLITGGVNVHPQDIEQIASAVAGVLAGRVCACSQFDERTQTERIVVLAETDRPELEHGPLAVQIRRRILAALQIANFEVQLLPPRWLLKSSSGKMARDANRRKWSLCPLHLP